MPNQIGLDRRENLKQALGDEAELDVAMIGRDLSADGVAVGLRLAMEVWLPLTRRRGVMAAIQK